ncbi:DNA polymerase III subunit gamma/tau [Marinomonas sp. 2405UD68-3]|uniref:DNA polymerase III subunit gamma/tau n=1 Tax=Marinomonas sp. 2405UD68-3 TaxID=3391835 RepID=UPI0039C97BED
MSYQVLARKWRPQTFIEMAGQDHVLQALVNALRQQRLHHAYLFTGTRGVGKTTIARIFAKCLNCETNGISPEPCGTCSSCVEIAQGNFVDLIEVDAASRTKVEDTRELLENVQYAPTRGRFKVYLIDEVHMLSAHSFNALLKTLEEPPAHVKFLLATTDPQKLPVTVLSRCLQFNLKNMSSSRIVTYLTKILGEEQLAFEEAALWQIGQAANGSMRDALSLTDQAIAFGDGVISETGVTSMLGLVNQSQILALVEHITSSDALALLNKINELADYQPDFVAICASLMDVFHRIAIEQQVPGALEDQLGDLEHIHMLAKRTSPQEVQLLYQNLLIGRKDLHLAHSPKSGFEMLMLRLIAFRPAAPVNIEMSSEPVQPTVVQPNAVQSSVAQPKVARTEKTLDASPVTPVERTVDVPPSIPSPHESKIDLPVLLNEQDDVSVTPSESSDSLYKSAEVRPPWEEPVLESQAVETVVNFAHEDAENPPAEHYEGDDSVALAHSESSKMNVPFVEPEFSIEIEELEVERAVVKQDIDVKMTEASETKHMKNAVVDDESSEDENEFDAEERTINESIDPHFSVSDLVNALSTTDQDGSVDQSESVFEIGDEESLPKAQKRVVNTIAQPALAIELPPIYHFSELTMQIWWLVAPRLDLTGLVQNIVMNSSLIEATELGLKIQVPLEYGHMLNQVRYEQIQQALGDFFGLAVPLIIDTVEDVSGVTAEEFAASKRAEALQAAIDHLNSHPIVKGLSESLSGQLIYESVKVKA